MVVAALEAEVDAVAVVTVQATAAEAVLIAAAAAAVAVVTMVWAVAWPAVAWEEWEATAAESETAVASLRLQMLI